jgi:hypothetical protein
MKYLSYYKQFEAAANEKLENKIKKFFNNKYIIKQAIDLHPKLAIWIINQFKDMFIKDNDDIDKNIILAYFKTGNKDNDLDANVMKYWNDISRRFQSIIDWSKSFDITPEERSSITKMTFDEAYEKSEEWHNSLIAGGEIEDESGTIVMTFPDGFYWIDLETKYDGDEADAMGHCGRTNKGNTLYSLRDRNKSPHITVAIDTDDGIIYQMKGRNNKKPISKYHEYIVELLLNDDLYIKGFGSEYDKNNDFNINDLNSDLREKLLNNRPNINKPILSDDEIDNMYERYFDSYFIEGCDEYGYNVVSRALNADNSNYNEIINALTNNDTLYNILMTEYVDKNLEDDIEILKTLSTYVDADTYAKKYNIELPNKKDSNSNKWEILVKTIDYDTLVKILEDEAVLDKYESRNKYDIKYYTRTTHWNSIMYDYDDLLTDMFGSEENIIKELDKLFQVEDGKYCNSVPDVWDMYDLYLIVDRKLTTEEKLEEMETMDYYELEYDDY